MIENAFWPFVDCVIDVLSPTTCIETFLRSVNVLGTDTGILLNDIVCPELENSMLHAVTFNNVSGPVSHGTSVKQKAKAARKVHVEDVNAQCDAQHGFASIVGSKVASSAI